MADVDEKVVKLTLDNRSFKSDTDQTIKSLDELKKSLEFEGIGKGFDDITNSAAKVNLNPLQEGVMRVSNQFNALATIADSALRNVTNRAIESGEHLIKSLSVDQVTSGWSKFEQKTKSVATLLAQGFDMDTVNEQLDRLNWFTDETSYNFTDMVENISKFTATGKGLEESTTAMEGIALWAALSGQNAQKASQAMYQLSQALGAGYMRLEDYKSIQNVSMDTDEFREKTLEAAVALGTLEKVGDDTYKSLVGGGDAFSKSQFTSSLTEGAWFTSDVMMEVFKKYSAAVDQIYEYAEEKGITASQAMEELGDKVDAFGLKALKAGQEARSLGDALESVKDAVSTGWMKTFELIIGDSTEATELFTDMANALYDVFAESGNVRNELLQVWKDMGGRDLLIDSIKNLAANLYEIVKIIKDGFHDIFPPATVKTFVDMTNSFARFAAQVKLSETTAQNLRDIIAGIFSVLNAGITIVKTIGRALSPIFSVMNGVSGLFIQIIADVARLMRSGIDQLLSTRNMEKFYTVINSIAKVVASIAGGSLMTILTLANKIFEVVGNIRRRFTGEGGGIAGFITIAANELQKLWDPISTGDSLISKVINGALVGIGALGVAIGGIIDLIFGLITGKSLNLTTSFGDIQGWVTALGEELETWGIKDIFDSIIGSINGFITSVQTFVKDLFDAESDIRTVMRAIGNDILWLYDLIKDWIKDLTVQDIQGFIVIFMLWQFIDSMKQVNVALKGVFNSIKGTFGAATNVLKDFADPSGNFVDKLNSMFDKTKILQLGIAAALLVQSLRILTDMNQEKLIQSLLTLGIAAGLMIAVMKQMKKLNESSTEGGMNFATQFLAMSAGIILVAKAAEQIATLIQDNTGTDLVATFGILGGIMAAMVASAIALNKFAGNNNNLFGAATAMIAMAVAIRLISGAVLAFKGIKMGEIAAGIVAVSAMLVSLGGAAALMSKANWSTLLAGSSAILSMSTAVLILAGAMAAISNIEKIGTGILGLAAAAGTMAIALAILFGAASAVKPTDILAMSAALLSFSVAMVSFASSMLIMQIIPWQTIVLSLGSLVIALGALAVLNAATGGGIYAAAAALAALGVAAAGIGAGLLLGAEACIKFIEAGALFVGFILGLGVILDQMGEEWPTTVEKAFDALYLILSEFLMMVVKLGPQFSLAAATIVGSFALGIAMASGEVSMAALAIIAGILNSIANLAGPIVDTIVKLIDDITARMDTIMEAVGKFVEKLFAGIGTLFYHSILGMIEMLFNAIGLGTVGKQVTDYMRSLGEQTADGLGEGVTSGIDKQLNDIEDHAAAIPPAAASGINSTAGVYNDAGAALGAGGMAAYDNTIGYHSPPDEYITRGKSIPLAAASGIEATSDVYNTANETLAQGGMDKMSETITNATDQITKSMETTITNAANGVDTNQFAGIIEMPGMLDLSATYGQINNLVDHIELTGQGIQDYYRNLYGLDALYDISAHPGYAKYMKEAEEQAEEDGNDIGGAFASGLGSGIGSSTAGAAGARQQADTIAEAFQDQLSKYNLDEQTDDLLYKLWEAKNPNATDAEKKLAEVTYNNRKLAYATKELQVYQELYDHTVEKYGENTEEVVEAKQKYIQAQIDVLELQNKIDELQNKTIESTTDNAQSFMKFAEAVGESYTYLKESGFSDEEIRNSLANEAGWKQPLKEATQNLAEEGKEAATASANGVVYSFSEVMLNGISEVIPRVSDIGADATQALSDGMTGNIGLVEDAAKKVSGEAVADNLTNEIKPSWLDVGINIDDGLAEGIKQNESAVTTQIDETTQNVIDQSKNTAGINSPATEFIYIGQMMMEGLKQGIMQKANEIAEAAAAAVRSAIRAARAAAGVNSPSTEGIYIGEMLDLGVIKGIDNYAYRVSIGAAQTIEDAVKEAEDATKNGANDIQQYVSEMMAGKNELSVVLDVDTTELDNALLAYREKKIAIENGINRYRAEQLTKTPDGLSKEEAELWFARKRSRLNRIYGETSALSDQLVGAINAAAAAVSAKQALSEIQEKYNTTDIVLNYTQNNTSPEPLSRLDIYRDTQKQLSQFKESIAKNVSKRR